MKSLLSLWNELAEESAGFCRTSATRDIKTVTCRFEHEGLSFMTITLPRFGKGIQKCLDQGWLDPRLFTGFRFRGGLPRFLGGFLDRVFDRGSGRLLDEPCIDAILAIRQLTLLFGKIEVDCSDARRSRAMRGFIECEQEVRLADARRTRSERDAFQRMSSMLFASVFTEVDRKVYYGDIVPKHGPGATADRLMGNQKYNQSLWTSRLERSFPAGEFLLPNWRYYDQLDDVDYLEPGQELPVRVVTVPKTLEAPRIIAIEPTAMQYAQQGLMEAINDAVGGNDYLRHIIGRRNQVPNQKLARQGSRDGTLASLDLSEASDRVSNQLVRDMLAPWPHLHEAVDACRSRKADVDGETIRLAKFASMGSALTFPIEAIVFTTIIFLGIEQGLNRPLVPRDVKRLKGKVRVYGDDIIVPVDYVHSVVQMLQTFGFVVNLAKSFWTGRFRESCGKEYYADNDVSIVKVRTLFPSRRQDVTELESTVSLRNHLYEHGYWRAAGWLDRMIGNLIRFPVVLPTSPVLGRHSYLGYETQRLSPDTRTPQVKGYVSVARIPENNLDGSGALLKYFLKRGGLPSADEEHLERSGRPVSVTIRYGWNSAV